jgi:hypothetical protein
MERIKTILENSSNKIYYEQNISKFTDEQKNEFIDLVLRLDNAGAKNPLQWAYSETKEKIPQFGRFLVLKKLLEIAKSVEDNVAMASDEDYEIEEQFLEIQKIVGEKKLKDWLISYSKGLVYNLLELFDEGNRDYEKDRISWALVKTDEECEPTGQIIEGLHEDFIGFEDEIK